MSIYSPLEIEGIEPLLELALDIRWSWNHIADKVWSEIDPHLWETTHNPWLVLRTVSGEVLKKKLSDPAFRSRVDDLLRRKEQAEKAPGWYQTAFSEPPFRCAAYFSMEFMLSEALPIYSGGLGNVAGDQLKSASDLGVPVIAIGLLYQQGYFRQVIDKEGNQMALYPYNDPGMLPLIALRGKDKEWVRFEVKISNWSIWVRVWEVRVGRVKLYLLDSNDPANPPVLRGITSELYGGNEELRLKQEILLGIAGWKVFEKIGIKPEVCHLNEGHAALAVLERTRGLMKSEKIPFKEALTICSAGTLFTTHTAVAAGFDRFSPQLIEQYLGKYAQEELGISSQELLALGRLNPDDAREPFNMAYLAIHGSGAVNGVSRLHGEVSRLIFSPLFPRWPESEIPISSITNGVHVPSWDSVEADNLWTEMCGKERWLGTTEHLEHACKNLLSDEKIWQMRNAEDRPL